jgi:hypothetical protein
VVRLDGADTCAAGWVGRQVAVCAWEVGGRVVVLEGVVALLDQGLAFACAAGSVSNR